MTNMKSMNKRITLVLSLIVMIQAMGMHFVFAEGVKMPALDKESSTLAVSVKYVDEEETTAISGVELSAYKVADLTVEDGFADDSATKDFEAAGIDYNNLTTESSIKAASDLEAFANENKPDGVKAVSGADGMVDFGEVSNGMYLITQTAAKGMAEDYTRLKAYLVMAPLPMTEVGDNEWQYDVVSIPKTEIGAESIRITKKVNEKDSIEVTISTDEFYYDIEAELGYVPDNFAVVDKVPEMLTIINKEQVELKISGEVLSDADRDKMLSIEDNTVRVDFTKEQLKKWYPLKMKVKFHCQFREGTEITDEELSVINKAGYEVRGDYYEPPGEEHKAEVKGKEDEQTVVRGVKKLIKSVNTGDTNLMALWIGIILAVLTIIVFMLRIRRKQ